jgi:hypothetical protein
VRSGPHGVSARESPLILTSADSRFYEVYVGEMTRSYEDAYFTGEPIYSRDLLTGTRKLLFEETRVAAWEKSYLTTNPKARLLDPDEDASDDVSVAATGEADILAVAGPYVLYDRRLTLEKENFEQSDSSRAAIDIRTGTSVPLNALVRDAAILGAGAVREGNTVRWHHGGYDVVAKWDAEQLQTKVVLRDLRGREWPLGYVNTRLPRLFWLDAPKVDSKIRVALAHAFEEARMDDVETQLVRAPDRDETRRKAAATKTARFASYKPAASLTHLQ